MLKTPDVRLESVSDRITLLRFFILKRGRFANVYPVYSIKCLARSLEEIGEQLAIDCLAMGEMQNDGTVQLAILKLHSEL